MSDKFYNFDNDKKILTWFQNHKESYKSMILLFMSGFLNKWYLTETGPFINSDSNTYMRNALLFCYIV